MDFPLQFLFVFCVLKGGRLILFCVFVFNLILLFRFFFFCLDCF